MQRVDLNLEACGAQCLLFPRPHKGRPLPSPDTSSSSMDSWYGVRTSVMKPVGLRCVAWKTLVWTCSVQVSRFRSSNPSPLACSPDSSPLNVRLLPGAQIFALLCPVRWTGRVPPSRIWTPVSPFHHGWTGLWDSVGVHRLPPRSSSFQDASAKGRQCRTVPGRERDRPGLEGRVDVESNRIDGVDRAVWDSQPTTIDARR